MIDLGRNTWRDAPRRRGASGGKSPFSSSGVLLMSQTSFSILRPLATAIAACVLALGGSEGLAIAQAAEATRFPVASVHFEQNATDGDVEVVFKAKGGADGLAHLKVVSPDGRTVIDFTAPDPSTLGIRQFGFESPEPADVNGLKAAYPEGVYEFTGTTNAGAAFVGRSTLAHRLPAVVKFRTPAPEAEDVPTEDVEISWTAVAGVAFYIVEVEQDELGTKIEAVLPSTLTAFAVPNGFLTRGKEYQLGIGSVTEEGNISFVETSFSTRN